MNLIPEIRAGNGALIEPGGIYLTFSGDYDRPYTFAKIIQVVKPTGPSDRRLTPDGAVVGDLDLWLKLFYDSSPDCPNAIPLEGLAGRCRVIPVSVSMFLAWGPPKFPIRLGSETVTADELARCVDDWYLHEPP